MFRADERGSVTIWLLMWSIIFIGFAGLAIDVSNAFRTRSMLQATADAAAHAGAIRLVAGGDEAAVDAEAMAYAQANLPIAGNGTVVLPQDVTRTTWDPATRTFDDTAAVKNAVRVIAQRASVVGETTKLPLPTSLLRIIDFNSWNITVVAIAAQAGGLCTGKSNWMIAMNDIQFTSGNAFGGDLCLYGQNGIEGNMNNSSAKGVLFVYGDPARADYYGWDVMECTDCEHTNVQIPPSEASALLGLPEKHVLVTREAVMDAIDAGTGVKFERQKGGGGKDSAEENMGVQLAAGKKAFAVSCQNTNTVIDLEKMVAAAKAIDPSITGLSGVTIYTGPMSGDLTGNTGGEGCEINGSNLILDAVTIASTNDKGGSIVDPGNSASASTDNVSVKLNGQPTAGGGCVANVTTYDDGLNIFSLGGVNFTAQGDFSALRIYAEKNVNFTAGPSTTGALDIRTSEGISFTAGAVFDPACPVSSTDIPFDMTALRLVL
ncbi:MAG: pilus assembly protein TadG-related protein [Thermohalobaculum sp.]|nr:pilus assembly protein TadG-related protein [Thermohalobaculum sp.]